MPLQVDVDPQLGLEGTETKAVSDQVRIEALRETEDHGMYRVTGETGGRSPKIDIFDNSPEKGTASGFEQWKMQNERASQEYNFGGALMGPSPDKEHKDSSRDHSKIKPKDLEDEDEMEDTNIDKESESNSPIKKAPDLEFDHGEHEASSTNNDDLIKQSEADQNTESADATPLRVSEQTDQQKLENYDKSEEKGNQQKIIEEVKSEVPEQHQHLAQGRRSPTDNANDSEHHDERQEDRFEESGRLEFKVIVSLKQNYDALQLENRISAEANTSPLSVANSKCLFLQIGLVLCISTQKRPQNSEI